MKLNEVSISRECKDNLMSHELISVNYNGLKADFETHYVKYFDTEMGLTEEQAINAKSNMFDTFCTGAIVATNNKSNFRRNFNLPKSVIEEMNKPKVIVPEKPKLILK